MAAGRQRVLDDAKQREVCALVSAGCSLAAAARYVDCAPRTIRREARRNAAFAERFRKARVTAQLSPLQAMNRAAATHWRAAAWMLERSDPDNFAPRVTPAFRPKQAQALVRDVLAVIDAEFDNEFQRKRVHDQIHLMMRYAIHGVMDTERTGRQLREAMKFFEARERESDLAEERSLRRPHTGGPGDKHAPPQSTTNGHPTGAKTADRPATNGSRPATTADRPATMADLAECLRSLHETLSERPPAGDKPDAKQPRPTTAAKPSPEARIP